MRLSPGESIRLTYDYLIPFPLGATLPLNSETHVTLFYSITQVYKCSETLPPPMVSTIWLDASYLKSTLITSLMLHHSMAHLKIFFPHHFHMPNCSPYQIPNPLLNPNLILANFYLSNDCPGTLDHSLRDCVPTRIQGS